MSLLPSRGPDASTTQEGEMQVLGVDEDVDQLLDALSSDTARNVLTAIYDEPGTPSEIADRLDMSIQKVAYHLEKLEDQDLIAVAGTRYSEKGQEMTVYEPPEEPLVLFVGTEDRKQSLKSVVKRLLPTIGILAIASGAVQYLFGRDPSPGVVSQGGADSADSAENFEDRDGGDAGGGDGDAGGGGGDVEAADAGDTPTEAPTEEEDVGIAQDQSTETEAPEATEQPMEADANATGAEDAERATETVDFAVETTAQSADAAGSALGTLPPGVAFFLGGLLVVTIVAGVWAYRTYA